MDLYSSLLNKLLLYRSQPGQQTEKEASPSGPMKTLLLRWLHHDVFLRVEKGLKVALEASIGSEHCCLRAKISFPAVSASGCGAEEFLFP
ncbi:hypothetical protein NC652_029001 [Populus alba x Populus x berolinensis]|nr:hypothetical protein NC652_029001 [Populus alba x Populus x berolinensis]